MKKYFFNTGMYTGMSALIIIFSVSIPANATPSFASKYDKKCSYCHNAWPQLNAKGRGYRERGYRLKEDLKEEASSITELGTFPISALVQARPYDKKKSGDRKLRAIQEIELFFGGAINHQVSAFFEVEAEDEVEFIAELANMALSYRVNDAVNIHMTFAPSIWGDSYGFLGSQFRVTRGRVGVTDNAFGGGDNVKGKMNSRRQNVELSGRVVDSLFYSVGVSGEAKDFEGVKSSGYSGRLAYDITKNVMIGAFGVSGETQDDPDATPPINNIREYSRTGIDFQADIGNSRLQAAYLTAEDDNVAATAKEKNNAYSIQYLYTVKTKSGSPTFVPIIRLDQYEKADGEDSYQELTLNLTYYINENFKAFIEYWDQLDVPDNKVANDRTTLQLAVNF